MNLQHVEPHAREARGSLLDSEVPGSGDVTPLFHMTGLSHPGAGSPVRAASSQWARPRCRTRISASPGGQRTGKRGESFRQRCVAVGFPVPRPSWLPYFCVCAAPCSVCATTGSACVSTTRLIFNAVIRPGKLRCELHLERLEPEVERPGSSA